MTAHYDIYTLSDNTGIRYVGQTGRGWATRLRQYRTGSRSRVAAGRPGRYTPTSLPDLRRHWMDGLTAAGRLDEIRMEVIGQAASKAEADALEQDRIAYYLAQGCDLVNTNHNPRGRDLDRALKAAWKVAQNKD